MSKRIDKFIVDRILETAKIEEVVGDFVDLRKKGVRYLGLCPFHNDENLGSFVVYPKGNCYKCFACGAKGGVVDFLMEHAKLSYPDAIRWLGKKYSIETDMEDFNYTPPPPRPKPQPLPTLTLPMSMVTAREVCTTRQNRAAQERTDGETTQQNRAAQERTDEARNGQNRAAQERTDGETTQQNREEYNDRLVRWICEGVKWDRVQRGRIAEVLHAYHVGHSKGGHTIFWQIDENGGVRTGKMMKYREDGHRDREARWGFDFIHSTLSRRHDASGKTIDEGPWPYPDIYNPDKQEMRMTYFGMHLLNRYRRRDVEQAVCIVESEKTAVLMAIAYGNNAKQVWMACGGMMNLTRERLAPIIAAHRPIILYPDRDGIQKWRDRANEVNYDRLTIDTRPVTDWWLPEDGEKADIADVVVRGINNSTWKPKNTGEVVERMPEAEGLIEKFGLEIEDEERENDSPA